MRARWSVKSRLFTGVLVSAIITTILPISVSANTSYAEANKIVWTEDFSDGDTGWGLANGFDVTDDGMLHYAATAGVTSNGQAAFDVSSLGSQLSGKNFCLRFKVKVKNETSHLSSNMALDGTRIPQTAHFMGGSASVPESTRLESEQWYERCYVYQGTQLVDIYQRKETESTWSVVGENIATTNDYNGNTVNGTSFKKTIYFGGVTNATARNGGFEAWLDDFVIHIGDVAFLEEPIVSGNDVMVNTSFCLGRPGDVGDRSATVFAVVYDAEVGVTKFVDSRPYTDIKPSVTVSKEATFTLPALGEKDKTAYFIWDSLENGAAMSEVMGYSIPNQAEEDAAPGSGQEVGVRWITSYNQVQISGYIGDAAHLTASLIDSNGTICAILQCKPNANGMVDADLTLDESYSSDTYTLRVNYGGASNICETVSLIGGDVSIDTIADVDDYQSFITTYGSAEEKAEVIKEGVAAAGYEYFCTLAGTEGFTNVNALREALQESLKAKGYLDAINTAVSTGDWESIERLVTGDAKAYFEVPDNIFAGVGNIQAAILRMTGGYTDKRTVLADLKAAIATQKAEEKTESKVVWTEDFSGGGSGWTLENGFQITNDGVLHYKATNDYNVNGAASYNVGGILEQLTGKVFALRFKVKVKNASSYFSSNMAFDGTRIPQAMHFMGGVENIAPENRMADDTWYERCYVYNGTNKVSIYQRKLTENTWTLVAADVVTQTFNGGTVVHFGGVTSANARNNQFEGWVDDLVVHIGDAVILDEPVIDGNTATVKGSYCLGLPPATGERTTTVIVAVYDTVTGNTSFADKAYYGGMTPGIASEQTTVFTLPDLEANEKVAFLVWDSIEGGNPMSPVTGYVVPNQADKTARPAEGQPVGVEVAYHYNKIAISGYVGASSYVTASLVDENGNLCSVLQTEPTERGMVEVDMILDPEKYSSGTYTVFVNYGGESVYSINVPVVCDDVPYRNISSAESYKNFILQYGNDADKVSVQETGVADAGYDYLSILAGADGITDFNEFRNIMGESLKAKQMLDRINAAVVSRDWYAINALVTGEAKTYLQISGDIFEGVSNTKEAILRMTGNYTSNEEVLADLQLQIAEQIKLETGAGNQGGMIVPGPGNQPGGGGFAGGGGGGGFAGGGAALGDVFADEKTDYVPQPVVPQENTITELSDLNSVPWAKSQILELQKLSIVNGEGDGRFYPDRTVSREEFLKMALKAAGIELVATADVPFVDVDRNAWYFESVATAYSCGIVNGISDAEFGIGQNISRADMAVIMKRILDYIGCDVEPTIAAYVFDDFWEIPEYAQKDISALCEAELMNGTGNNLFQPLASATRAEAAVLVYRINQYIEEER